MVCPPGNDSPPEPQRLPPATGMAIASLFLGLCSLLVSPAPAAGLGVSIIGLLAGLQARKNNGGNMATAGVVLCITGLIASFISAAIGPYMGG